MKIVDNKITPTMVQDFLDTIRSDPQFQINQDGDVLFSCYLTMSDDFELEAIKFDEWRDAMPNSQYVVVYIPPCRDFCIYSKAYLQKYDGHPRHDSYYEQQSKVGAVLRTIQRYYSYMNLKDKTVFDWNAVDKPTVN